ncbi:MAG: hypothetical protein IKK58_02680 [Clostridia bacterium]|nr:hypothetical protein [Clostridia bacterium]
MKKALILTLALLLCSMPLFACAGSFAEDNGLLYVTEGTGFSEQGALTSEGDGIVTLTDDRTIKIELEDYAFSGVYYCCTPDNGGSWNPYLNYENNFYSSSAYIMKIKNGAGEVGITPASIAFDSSGGTFYAGITANDEAYPIALVNADGTIYRAESYYSIDRYFITIPANFDGFVVIPYDRLTADLSEGTEEAEGDLMSYHNDNDYRFFWALGMQVESLAEGTVFFEFEGVYLSENPLELDIPEEGFTPEQTDSTEPGTTDEAQDPATDAPQNTNTPDPAAPTSSLWIYIAIGAAVVVVVAVVVIIILKKKKA